MERGAAAEGYVLRRLERAGWRILGRNVRVRRLELDIVAVDPGPVARLVAIEVRFRADRQFGLAEETFDRGKRLRTVRALAAIGGAGHLPDGTPVPHLAPAVDLIVVEPATPGSRAWRVRHHRDVLV